MLVRAAGLPPTALNLPVFDAAALEVSLQQSADLQNAAKSRLKRAFSEALETFPEGTLRTELYNTRKKWYHQTEAGRYLPLPIDPHWSQHPAGQQLTAAAGTWNHSCAEASEWRQKNSARYHAQLEAEYRALQQFAQNSILRRALLFASQDLLDNLDSFCEKDPAQFAKKERQTARSIWQYGTRAVFKTSPLSHFTTVGWQRLSPTVDGAPDWMEGFGHKSAVTPNVALLPALYDLLLESPAFYCALSIVLNPCIVSSADVEYEWLFCPGDAESVQTLMPNPTVDFLVDYFLSEGRTQSFAKCRDLLATAAETDPEVAAQYLFDLLDIGFFEWEWPEKGLTPSWCAGLYNFLGFLPNACERIVETASLLQWLRGAARTLPFQTIADAQATQREAAHMLKAHFERFGMSAPKLPPEQIFFEDVECPTSLPLALSDWETIAAELKPIGNKIGALLQCYRENGQYKAVVNALFPGGGKLMARWMHLFPPDLLEALRAWFEPDWAAFPWQGWHNAAFQPTLAQRRLAVPGGRSAALPGSPVTLLGHLALKNNGAGGIALFDQTTGAEIALTDLGLEALQERPPSMQVLWRLGVPPISKSHLLPAAASPDRSGAGWKYWERIEKGPLVLARARWEIEPSLFAQIHENAKTRKHENSPLETFIALRVKLAQIGVPTLFFALEKTEQEHSSRGHRPKPQYFDANSPFAMQIFAKWTEKPLTITEMLPCPTQWVCQKEGSPVAAETVIELVLGE